MCDAHACDSRRGRARPARLAFNRVSVPNSSVQLNAAGVLSENSSDIRASFMDGESEQQPAVT